MTNESAPVSPAPASAASPMRSEIIAKWGRFNADEIAALKNNDDLTAQLQKKYNLEKSQAQKDVDAFAKGRTL